MARALEKTETLAEFFAKACNQYAQRNACTFRPTFRRLSWTYEDLWNHSTAFYAMLQHQRVQTGDRVVLIGFNSPYWVAAFIAIQLKGAIAVPLSPESSNAFTRDIIKQTAAKVLLHSLFVDAKNLPIPSFVLEHGEKATLSSDRVPRRMTGQTQQDIAEIVYTSGTTGNPKGAVLTHENLLSNLWASRKRIRVHGSMRFASVLPLFHMFEQIGGLLVPFSAGCQISYAASRNPNHVKWIFEDDKVNRMLVVPEFLRILHMRIQEQAKEQGKQKQLDLLLRICSAIPFMALRRALAANVHKQIGWRMHTIVSGGAALDQEAAEFWETLGVYILQGYGLTEASPVISANTHRNRSLASVGKPLAGVSVNMAEDGEILAKGPNIFRGYWKNPKKTKEVFDEHGWFHTGDIGAFDKKGHLHIKGRKKFVIVLPSGENVYAEDVEAELIKNPGVQDATVIALKKARGEEAHAVLILEERANAKRIIEQVNANLFPYQRIQGYTLWPHEDFPRTPTRKIKKREVTIQVLAQMNGEIGAPADDANLSKLERIIAQVLEVRPSAIKDSKRLVADFHMDSLARIELVGQIENELSVALDEGQITQFTTVKDVKEMVADHQQKQIRYPFRATPFTPLQTFLRSLLQSLFLKPAMVLYAPAEVRGRKHLRSLKHPALFFSNHLSTADGAVLYGVLPSRIRRKLATAAASDVVYESDAPWIKHSRWFLELLFPVFPFTRHEGQVKSSFVYTGRILDREFSVLLFPEGRTSPTGQFQPLKQGAGLLGVEMDVPIVPVKLQDTQHIIPAGPGRPVFQWPKRHKVTVSFGKPFRVDPGLGYPEATALIEARMREL